MQDADRLVPDSSTQISQGSGLRPDPHQPAIGEREQRIRARAHEIWEAEGRPSDRAEAHWQRAEQEIAADTSDYVMQKGEKTPGKPGAKRSAPK